MTNAYRLNLFPDEALESDIDDLTGAEFLTTCARQVLRYLWQNWSEDAWPSSFFDKQFFKKLQRKHHSLPTVFRALIKERDPFLLKATRQEVQVALDNLMATLAEMPPTTELEQLGVQLAIHNMLSIYAMFSPSPFETLRFPQLIDDEWQAVEFTIEAIELTPTKGAWVNFLGDRDRLFSYGFVPKNNEGAHSVLMHCGTGWPTAQGSFIQILADIWPSKTPGEIFFEWQHGNLKTWLDKQNHKVVTAGQSLGGSLAYLTAMFHPEKVSEAFCLVPPGLGAEYNENHPLFKRWFEVSTDEKPTVYIQKQKFDPVSKCGVFPEDEKFKLLLIELTKETKLHAAPRLLSAHARSFITCDNYILKFGDMAKENQSAARKANNDYLYHSARPWIFYTVLAPYFFITKPFLGWLNKNAFSVAATLIFSLSLLFAPISIPLLGSSLLGAIILGYAASYTLTTLISLADLPRYIAELKQLDPLAATGRVLYDFVNILSFGALNLSVKAFNLIFNILPNFFAAQQPERASIHTQSFHDTTENLDDHPAPSINDQLQVLGFVILFYSIALPVKFVLYDLPQWLGNKFSCCFGTTAAEESPTLNSPTPDLEPGLITSNQATVTTSVTVEPSKTTWTPTLFGSPQDSSSKTNEIDLEANLSDSPRHTYP